VNAWLELPLAIADLVLTVGAGLLSGLAELTRPAPPPAPLVWPDDREPVLFPVTDRQFERWIEEFTWDPRWDGVLRQEP
jgi:hypothetical protein